MENEKRYKKLIGFRKMLGDCFVARPSASLLAKTCSRLATTLFFVICFLTSNAAYAQYTGGSGKGDATAASSAALISGVSADANVKLVRQGQVISGIARSLNTVTVTLSTAYPNSNLKVGQKIAINLGAGGTASFNGTFTIASVASQTSFTYAQTGVDATGTLGTDPKAGGDYTTLTAWEAGEQGDLVAGNKIAVAECYNDWASGLVDNLTFLGSTTDATHYMRITVPSSEQNTGATGTGFRIAPSSGDAVTVSDAYAALEGVEAVGATVVSAGKTLTTANSALFTGGLTVSSTAVLNAQGSNITIATSFTFSGTINAAGSVIKFSDCSTNFSTGTFNPGQGLLIFSGSSGWAPASGTTYDNVAFVNSGANAPSITGTAAIAGKLVLDTGGAALTGGTINLTGDLIFVSGAAAGGTTAVNLTSATEQQNISCAAGALPALTINKTGQTAYITGTATLQNVTVTDGALTFNPGTYTITAGKTISVAAAKTLNFTGLSSTNWVTLTSSGNWTLTKSGTVTAAYVKVDHSQASATVTATNSVDYGSNLNWVFSSGAYKYWTRMAVSGDGNFTDAANWSGGVAPISTNNVIFDANGTANCNFTAATTVASLTNAGGYTGTLSCGANNLTVNGALSWKAGTLDGGSATITTTGNADFSGGAFTAGTSTVAFTVTANNTFTPGSSTYKNISVAKGTGSLTISGTAKVSGDLTQTSGQLTSGQIDLSGNYIINGGNCDTNTPTTVRFMGTVGQSITQTAGAGAHVTIEKDTDTFSIASGITIASLNHVKGAVSGIDSNTITFSGWNATFTPHDLTYKNIIVNKVSSGTLTVSGTATVSGDLTLTQGKTASGTYNVGGNVTVASTFLGASGAQSAITLNSTTTDQTYTGASGVTAITGDLTINKTGKIATISGTGTFNNITVTAGTLKFNPGTYTIAATKTINVQSGATLNFGGTGTGLVTLTSTGVWNLTRTGTVTADLVDVAYSNASATIASTNSINSGNNTNWTFTTPLKKWTSATAGNWSVGANWSGGTAPTSSDSAFFSSAGAGACTVDTTGAVAANVHMTSDGGTLILGTNNTLTVSGDVTLAAGKVTANTGSTLAMNATGTLISAGNTLYNLTTSVGTITLGDASNVSNIFTHTSGTFITDGGAGTLTHNWGYFNSSTANVRTITLGNSTINLNGTFAGVLAFGADADLTFNCGTSTINFTGVTTMNIQSAGAITFNVVNMTGSGTQRMVVSGTIFGTLTRTGTAVKTDGLQIEGNFTVTGALSLAGNSATNRLLVKTDTLGTARTITVTGANLTGCANVDFMDITMTPAQNLSAITGGSGNCGGNTGITFTTSAQQTWNGTTGNWSDVTKWSGSPARVPLPQDNVVLAGTNTVTADMPRLGANISFSAAAILSPSISVTSYGSLDFTNSGTFTFGSSKLWTFSGRSNHSITSSGKNLYQVLIAAPSGTYTFNDAFLCGYAFSITNGSLSTNSNVTLYSFDASASTTVTLSTGASNTWTITNASTNVWRVNATTTINAGNSTIAFTSTSASNSTFNSGTQTYNNITLVPSSGTMTFSGAFTFANMTMASAGTKTVKFTKNTTYTMTGTNFLNGTAGNLVTITSDDGTTAATLTKSGGGTVSSDYLDITVINVTPADTWYYGAGSVWHSGTGWVGSMSTTSVTPANLVIGITGNVTADFTTLTTIPDSGKIAITFPSGFNVTGAAYSSSTGISGTLTAGVSGQVVTVTGITSTTAGAKTLVLSNIKNPNDTGVTGTYTITTKTSADVTIDTNAAVSGSTIANGGSLTSTNVEPASLYAAAVGNVTVSFTTANPMPSDGKIEITFPTTSGSWTFDSGGTTAATSATMDGTLSVGIVGQVVTLTRTGGTQEAVGAESITLTYIKNPTTAGSTGVYAIKTATASGVSTGRIDQDTAVTADTMISVNLTKWGLNMNTGKLSLYFDSPVNAGTLTTTGITIQNEASASPTASRALTGGTGSPASGTLATGDPLEITLTAADLNTIKANASLAKAAASSYLSITTATIQDTSGNTANAIAQASAMIVTNNGGTYTADTTAPALSSWSLDMNSHQATLNFSESVKVSTWAPTAVTLQNTASSPTKTYALTAGSTTDSVNGTQIVVDLSTTDFNAVIDITGGGLCIAQNTSYITMTSSAITDMATTGNSVTAVTTGVNASSYTANTVTATNFKITTAAGATMTAGTTKAITIKAYDDSGFRTPAYEGTGASAKSLTFSGANASTDGYTPTATNKDSSDTNFGSATTVNFTNGAGASTLTLYKREAPLVKAAATGVATLDADGLSITVNPETKAKLVFTRQPSTTGTINSALAQQPKVAIRDTYGNQTDDTDNIILYDSSLNIAYQDASGTLSSSHTNNTLAAVLGEATFSGVKYDTVVSAPNYIYIYAESGTLQPAWSDGITFSSSATSSVALPASQVGNFGLNPVNDTIGEKFEVLKFKIVDAGGDSTATMVDRVKIAIAGTGANASTDIAWARLYKYNTGTEAWDLINVTPTIANDYITFGAAPDAQSDADLDSVADSSNTEYKVDIYMKASKLTATEGQTYTFTTNETLIGTDTGVSSQMAGNSSSITAVVGTIAVTMTHFEIVDATSGNATTSLAAGGTVELRIRATDINKNVDTTYTGNKTLVFSGLNTIGVYKPKIEAVAFGYNITINFSSGQSAANAVTLTAYMAETANISVVEAGVSPAYTVFTCAATVSAGTANTLAKTSGDTQIGKTLKALPTTLIVTATDTYGNPKSGETVSFAAAPSGCSFNPSSGTTGSNGQLATIITLGSADGVYTTTATPTGFGSAVQFTATGYTPRGIYIVSGNNQSKTINQVLDSAFTAKLVDAAITDGNAIPNETVTWSISSVPPSAAGQSLSSASGVTPSNGQVSTTLTLGDVTGDYIIRATYTGVTPNLTKDFTATGTSAGATKIALTGPSSITAGSASSAFTITTKDIFNNTVALSTQTVFNLSTTPVSTGAFYGSLADAQAGTNAITQVTIAAAASSGQFWYKHTAATTITVTAARASGQALPDGATSALSNISIVPASLDHFAVTATDTSTMTAGAARTITVTAYDTYNNPATNLGTTNVKFKFADAQAHASPGGNSPTCGGAGFGTAVSLAFSGANGQATASLILYKPETTTTAIIKAYTDSGTDTSDAQDLAFNVKHAAANHLKLQNDIVGTKTAGTAFNFDTTLDAVDLYANVCDGANTATAYSGSYTIGWDLSGLDNAPDASANDVFTNPVSFTAGRSTTTLSATLYRAQSTTITPSVAGLSGTNTASNSITVGAGAINKLSWNQAASATGTTNAALAAQPIVAVADQYGNAATNASGSITLRASSTTGTYTAVTNGTLSATALTVNLSTGLATFAGVKYSYPETIYLEASVVGYSLDAIYSSAIALSCASELTVAADTTGLSSTISSIANATANKVAVYAFKVTDAGADGYDGKLTKIIINRAAGDAHDWTTYVNDAIISDGTTETLGTVAASAITFGTGASTIYTTPNNSNKTYTLYVTMKNPLPTGADGESLSFTMDADTDITMAALTSSTFGATSAVSRSATVAVAISALKITGTSTVAAGVTNALTIKAIDANGNIDKDYTGNKSMTFSGPSASPDATSPVCSNYAAQDVALGTSTAITFASGEASAAVDADELKLKLYKVEIAVLAVTDGTYSSAGSNRLSITVTVGAAAKLFWNTQPEAKVVASAPWKLFAVGITDAYGNTNSNATNTVTIAATGGTIGSAATYQVAASSGVANFTNFFVTCASYPGTVSLNATAASMTASGASVDVTVAEKYKVTFSIKDSVSAAHLTSVIFEVVNSSGTTLTGYPYTSNSPFVLDDSTAGALSGLAAGSYTINLSKEKYVDSGTSFTAGVSEDGIDGTYDNTITQTIYMTSTEEATADYKVLSSFVYDEDTLALNIRMWLERRGKLVVNSDMNKLGTATIDVFDDTNSVWLTTVTFDAPTTTDYTKGVYSKAVANALSASNSFGRALVSGKTYYAKCRVRYGGNTDASKTAYEGGTTFTITITQKLSQEIITKLGIAAGETLSSTLTANLAQTAASIASSRSAVEAKVAASQTAVEAKVASVKSETASILTATQSTLPSAITTAQTTLSDIGKSKILNSESAIRSGQKLTVRYRTYTGLAPKIDIYNAENSLKVNKGSMAEIGTTGIYEYDVTFQSGWGRGDFTIICSETTKGTLDAMTITIIKTDIEQVNNQVSAVLGTTAGLSGISAAASTLNSQISIIESALSRVSASVSKAKEAAASVGSLEAVYSQIQNIANQVKQMAGDTGLNLEKLYKVSADKKQDMNYLKNKTQQLKAAMDMSQQMIDNVANKPVTQVWYEYQ